jgi:CBS domain-containing protein
MKVSDLQHQELFTAQADESLDVAADRMNWHQVGALPVLEGQHLVGIITERDVTAAMAEGADAATTPLSDYMTPAPEVLQPDSELADATHLMLELGIRHLPIVRGGCLVGVLSMRDLLDAEIHHADGWPLARPPHRDQRDLVEAAHWRAVAGPVRALRAVADLPRPL